VNTVPSITIATALALLSGCGNKASEQGAGQADAATPVPNQLKPCEDLERCVSACASSSAADCLAAANNLATGAGTAKDEVRATALFASACTLKSGAGCNLAGRMYEFGHGVAADPAKALALYEEACSLAYAGGCYNVATLLEAGRGAPVDKVRALGLYRSVCASGSQTACAAVDRLAAGTPK
jgi:TPR repeat protein